MNGRPCVGERPRRGPGRWLGAWLVVTALLAAAPDPVAAQSITAPHALFKSTLHEATITVSGIDTCCNPGTLSYYTIDSWGGDGTLSISGVSLDGTTATLTLSYTGGGTFTTNQRIRVNLDGQVTNSGDNQSTNYITVYAEDPRLIVGSGTRVVAEYETTATLPVRLLTEPSGNVTISVFSQDTTEGSVDPAALVFTRSTWWRSQLVTVTGVDDSAMDGDQTWNVRLDPSSGDTQYNALANVDVAFTTLDDEGAPVVNSATITSTPATGSTYALGEHIEVQVGFDQSVTVTGTPRLALTIGSNTRQANYASGTGTTTLTFRYPVQVGDLDGNGIAVGADAVTLNGGTIRLTGGTVSADLRLRTHAITDAASHKVEAVHGPPGVIGVAIGSPEVDDTFERGEPIEVTVTFNKPVAVTGSPQLALRIGTNTRQAAYVSGTSTSTALRFRYTVVQADVDADGLSIGTNALTLNGGTIRRAGSTTVNAVLGLGFRAITDSANHKVAGGTFTTPAPIGLRITSTPKGYIVGSGHGAYIGPSYVAGEVLEVTVTYDRRVTVTGTPQIMWDVEGSNIHQNLDYVSGSGTRRLVFRRTVQSSDRAETPIAIAELALNSGTITDARDSMVAATLSLHPTLKASVTAQEQFVIRNAVLAEILVSRSTLAVTEGSTSTYTVRLNKAPAGNVVVTANEDSPLIRLQRPGDSTWSQSETLTLTTTNWNTAQTVLVNGVSDADAAPGSAAITHAVVDAQSSNEFDVAVDKRLAVTVTDDDTAAIIVSPSSVNVTEGAEAAYTLRLSHVPTGNVRVIPRSSAAAHARVSTTAGGPYARNWSLMTFTPTTWNTAQTVYVEGREDANFATDRATIRHAVYAPGSADEYDAVTKSLPVTVLDNDMNPLTLTPQAITVQEGGSGASYTVALTSAPTAQVMVSVSSTAATVMMSPSSLTFSATTWNTPQTVSVTPTAAANDQDAEDATATVRHAVASTDPRFAFPAQTATDVTVTIEDDERPGVTISTLTLSVDEDPTADGGTTAHQAIYTVVLNTAIVTGEDVGIEALSNTPGAVLLSSARTTTPRLTADIAFFPATWNTAQTITVHAQSDANGMDEEVTISHRTFGVGPKSGYYTFFNQQLAFLCPTCSADKVITIPAVTVNVDDDDPPLTPTLALSPASIMESGGVSTVTATLDRAWSDGAVTITVAAAPGAGTATLSSAPRLIVAANATASTGLVTLTAVDNATDAPDTTVTVSGTAADSVDLASDPAAVTLTIPDDDGPPDVTLALSPASVAENGGVSTVSATLSHPSSAATTVTVTPQATFFTVPTGAAGQIVIAAGMTAAAGDVATLTAVNDDVYHGSGRTTPVSATLANSHGTGTVTGGGATLTLTDTESVPTVTLALSTTAVTENGGTATVTATLSGPASQAVTLTVAAAPVSPAVAGDFALSPAPTLTIAAGATTSTGTVTVTAVDNAVNAADKTVTVSATAAGGHGVSAPSDVTLTLTDDDTPGIAVVPATATDAAVRPLRTSESGGTATFTVALTTRPTGAVVLDLASLNTAEGTVLPTALTFAATAWNTAQPVTLTGVDDDMATPPNPPDGNQDYSVTLTTTSTADVDYNALAVVTVYAVNADNEYGLDLSVGAVTVTEAGGSATFTVALITQPSAAVTVAVSSLDSSEGRVSPAALTFAATAWNTAQTVRVTGVDDAIHDGPVTWQVRLDSSSGDSNYHGLADLDVSVITTDDETAPDVTLALAPTSIAENGGTTTVRATLTRASGAATTVTVTPEAGAYTVGADAIIVIPAEQTANSGDTATVIAVDDTIHQGSVGRSTTVTATVANSVGTGSVTGAALTLTDNEAPPGATLALSDASIPEMGGTSTVSATLSVASAVPTTVTVTAVDGAYTVGSDAIIAIPAGATANAADTVTITAVDNATDEPNRMTMVTGTLTNSRGAGTVSGVTLTLEDNDAAPTVTLAVSSTSITENNGQTMVSATLSNPSSAETTVTVTAVANAYTVASGTGATILLAAGSTASTDTATITAVDNARNAADNVVTVTATAANAQGVGTVTGPMLTITDDDVPGVTVAPPTSASARLRTTESGSMGGTATFAVTLATEPTGAVVLDVASSDTMEGTVLPAALTFQAADWNTEQTVTLTGVDDDPPTPTVPNQKAGTRDYTVTLTVNAAATADVDYDALGAGPPRGPAVTVYAKNADNEYGLDLSGNALTVDEAGGTATFTVALFTQPTGDVLVAVTSQAPNDVTVSPGSLTFTSGTWETKQTVTVTGVDDNVYDPTNPSYDVVLNPSSTADANYNGLDDETVRVTTEDDDELPTVTLALSPPAISENNEVATVTATLSGKTSEAVTLTVSATAVSPVVAADFTLSTATTLTIAAEQTTSTGLVTLTTKDNHVDTKNKTVPVSATATGGHRVAHPPNATLTITDDDEPGLVIAPTALTVEEPPRDAPPATATYTVQLATEPMAAVTVTVMKKPAEVDLNSNPDVVTVDPATLTFDASTWNTAQIVTVTTVPEEEDKDNYRHDIVDLTHTAMPDDADADRGYVSLSAAVTVTVTDTTPLDEPLNMLMAGEDTTINGLPVTLTPQGDIPWMTLDASESLRRLSAVEGIQSITFAYTQPAESPGVDSQGVVRAAGGPEERTKRYAVEIGADRRVVDITVRRATGAVLTADELASVLNGGALRICLHVSDRVQAAVQRLDRDPVLLHQPSPNDPWSVVPAQAAYTRETGRLCADLAEFSQYAAAMERGKDVAFAQDDPRRMKTFFTGTTIRDDKGHLPAADGDPPITYELLNMESLRQFGLDYDSTGESHGGAITGTPTTPTDGPQDYELQATDWDGDTKTIMVTIEVKPGIQSRDLALVLAGIGRTLASDAVEVLGGRFGSAPASRLQITLGGQVLRLTEPAAASTPSSSSPPSPLAGEGRGEGGILQGAGNLPQGERNVLQGEGSPLQGEATPAPASGPSPWQRATGLALSVAQALGVNLNLPASGSPSPLAGEGRGEGGILQGQGEFLQSDTLSGRLPTDRRRSTSTATSNLFRLQPVSAKDLLARSAFELPLTRTGDDGVPAWTFWGRGSAAGFAGQPEDDFTMDGTLYSGYLGLDYRHASLLMGLAVAHSTGEVNYERTGATKAGADVQLTSVLPYVHWQPYAGLGVWGLLGAGWGEMDLKLDGDPQTRSTRLNSWLGAVGGRQTLTTWQGIDLAAKTDAFLTTVRAAGTAEVPEAQGHAQRVRLLLEGRTAVEVSPVSLLEPRLELGGRWDSGTAEQGLGAELGGGVAYTRTDWGLSVDAQGRYLLVHEDGGFEDWGASVNVRVDPGVAGQGLYLTVSPVWGQASSGVEQLWSPTAALSQASGPARPAAGWRPGRVDVDVGYGLALADGRVLTPYGGLALGGPGSSRYRLGSRLALSASLAVNVEGERAEQPGQATAHSVSIRLGWQW